jgi:FKBP-type peptidyl-prolyl cis-trans isomerase
MRHRLAVVAAALLLMTGLTACGGGSGDSGDSASIDGVTVSGDFGKEPTVKVDGLKESKSTSDVLITGDGPAVADDGAVKVQVLLAKGTDGSTIQSSYTQGAPETLQLGSVPSWIKDAISGVKVGSRVLLVTPVSSVNGGQGADQIGLKSDDDLVFVFDLVEAAEPTLTGPKGTAVDPPADAPKIVEQDGKISALDFSETPKPPTEFEAIPLVKGEGATVKEGDSITVNYIASVWGADKAFDNSYESGQPASFQLAYPGLIKGWVKGLAGQKIGSRVMLVVPPEDGYGKKGNPQINVKGDDTLVFVIDLLGVGG